MAWTRHHWTLTFFYCLLIALFVTVCIYVYAGQQQTLSTRNFGNVSVQGLYSDYTELVTDTTSGTTLVFKKNKQRTFYYDSSSSVTTLTLPSKSDILALFPKQANGVTVNFGKIINTSGNNIAITVPTGITDVSQSGSTLSSPDIFILNFVYQDGDLLWNP